MKFTSTAQRRAIMAKLRVGRAVIIPYEPYGYDVVYRRKDGMFSPLTEGFESRKNAVKFRKAILKDIMKESRYRK